MGSKTFKFTLNNWTKKDRTFFENLDCNVCVFGEEVGEQGTPHLQGHITFKRNYRLTALKKLHNSTHWEVAKCGDFNYELKGDNVFIKDNRKQGHRSDLDEIAERISKGESVTEVGKAFPGQYIRYWKGIQELARLYEVKTEKASFDHMDCCEWVGLRGCEFENSEVIIGASGTGKTQYALSHFDRPLVVSHIDDLKDFKPNEHDGIVFDDMDFRHLPRTAQIHLTDTDLRRSIHCRYAIFSIPKNTKKIFTCNEYPFLDDPAINRRVTVSEVSER